jgi:hypothetical protein
MELVQNLTATMAQRVLRFLMMETSSMIAVNVYVMKGQQRMILQLVGVGRWANTSSLYHNRVSQMGVGLTRPHSTTIVCYNKPSAGLRNGQMTGFCEDENEL